MRFPFEKPTLRIYKYYFLGISEPIMIQAFNSHAARLSIRGNWKKLPPEYQESRIIGETVSVPVFGITERKVGGKSFLWVGVGITPDGWMERGEFEKKYPE